MSTSGHRDRCCASTLMELRRWHGNCSSRFTPPPRDATHAPLRLHRHGVPTVVRSAPPSPSASTLDHWVPLYPTRRYRSGGPPHHRRSGLRHPPWCWSGLHHHPQACWCQISSGVTSPDPIGCRVPEPPPRPWSGLHHRHQARWRRIPIDTASPIILLDPDPVCTTHIDSEWGGGIRYNPMRRHGGNSVEGAELVASILIWPSSGEIDVLVT
jgi:hypothetical protein